MIVKEKWRAEGNELLATHADGWESEVAVFHHFEPPAEERARLAAQAPTMARLLERLSDGAGDSELPNDVTAREIRQVLRDAGVIP